MLSKTKRTLLRPIPYLLSDAVGLLIARVFSRKLRKELCGRLTDRFLELLLGGMDLAFCLSKAYRRNIGNFQGRCFFRTPDNLVAAGATFRNRDMEVHREAMDDWNVRVTFKNPAALNDFLFSRDQDILKSVLRNDVEVDGNLNHIYRFGFLARDLARRLRVG